MAVEASNEYSKALKAGQKYYRAALSRGGHPTLLVLDDIIKDSCVAGYMDLGVMEIPCELLAGTKTQGRTSALAGNFMPLLPQGSEFAQKWVRLCQEQLEGTGIRDPIKCYEYMGRFYVEEGNKRCSVLISQGAAMISASVTRILPRYSSDPTVQIYYEFLRFYTLAPIYGLTFSRPGGYTALQAALGFEPEHVWTEEERRSFQSGFLVFRAAFDRLARGRRDITPADALLGWLELYSFQDLKTLPRAELEKKLDALWPDLEIRAQPETVALQTKPESAPGEIEERGRRVLSKLMGRGPERLKLAFVYAYTPEESSWTRAHEQGRLYLEERFGERIETQSYFALSRDFDAVLHAAAEDGAQMIFATTSSMIGACRRLAAEQPNLKVLNCALARPYPGVRTYYSRIHEAKFISGAIAGAMAENDLVGYVSHYPILGSPASINAFALGVRMTNPRAKVALAWGCMEEDPIRLLRGRGVKIITNRIAADSECAHKHLEWGTYMQQPDGKLLPLAVPYWKWGRVYEQIVLSVFSGTWNKLSGSRAINYWWGMDSGVIDVKLGDSLPDGVVSLGKLLRNGIIDGSVHPFRTRILDQSGKLRGDGREALRPEDVMNMDWLCENVEGSFPSYQALRPAARDIVRLLGVHREELAPEKETEKQL